MNKYLFLIKISGKRITRAKIIIKVAQKLSNRNMKNKTY